MILLSIMRPIKQRLKINPTDLAQLSPAMRKRLLKYFETHRVLPQDKEIVVGNYCFSSQHTILKHHSRSTDEPRYAVFDSRDPQGKGASAGESGGVFKIKATLKQNHTGDWQIDKTHRRIVKVYEFSNHYNLRNAHKEAQQVLNLNYLRAKHLVEDSVQNSTQAFLVMREMPGVNLRQWLETTDLSKLTTSEYLNLIIELLVKLKSQVHDRALVHRDVKPENILLGETLDPHTERFFKVNIVDFDLSTTLAASASNKKLAGTVGYIAPEIEATHLCSQASDVYSMGKTLDDVHQAICLNNQQIPLAIKEHIARLIKWMTKGNPAERCSLPNAIATIHAARFQYYFGAMYADFPAKNIWLVNQMYGLQRYFDAIAQATLDKITEGDPHTLRNLLLYTLYILPNEPATLRNYIYSVRIECLQHLYSQEMICNVITEVINKYIFYQKILITELETLKQNAQPANQAAIKTLETLLSKRAQRNFNLDEIQALNQRWEHKKPELLAQFNALACAPDNPLGGEKRLRTEETTPPPVAKKSRSTKRLSVRLFNGAKRKLSTQDADVINSTIKALRH